MPRLFYSNDLPPIRICVTGSRGKSGVARLIHAGLSACGTDVRTRVTGVVPRELSRDGEKAFIRTGCATPYEVKWWLRSLPAGTQAAVCENSAVNPAMQGVIPAFLKPCVTVLTNTYPDHTDFWGETEASVLSALSEALPRAGTVVLPAELAERFDMRLLAEEKKLRLVPVMRDARYAMPLAVNIPLALAACAQCGADTEAARAGMEKLPPDIADSCIINDGGAKLAFAFSINDIDSTRSYFSSLGWREDETVFIFNNRSDRAARFAAFEDWMRQGGWKKVQIIGDRPSALCDRFVPLSSAEDLSALVRANGVSFGCGNTVSGWPLEYKLALEEHDQNKL